jgi:hypothetical protein
MSLPNQLLARDEQVLYKARQHIFVAISHVLAGLSLISLLLSTGVTFNRAFGNNAERMVAGLRVSDLALVIIAVISGIVLASTFGDYLRWWNEQYLITDRRILLFHGTLSQSTVELSLGKITRSEIEQSMLGRIFNYGRIKLPLDPNETNNVINILDFVARPREFQRILHEAKSSYDSGYGYLEPDVNELSSLLGRGILTDAEFDQKKRELLNRN